MFRTKTAPESLHLKKKKDTTLSFPILATVNGSGSDPSLSRKLQCAEPEGPSIRLSVHPSWCSMPCLGHVALPRPTVLSQPVTQTLPNSPHSVRKSPPGWRLWLQMKKKKKISEFEGVLFHRIKITFCQTQKRIVARLVGTGGFNATSVSLKEHKKSWTKICSLDSGSHPALTNCAILHFLVYKEQRRTF